MTFLTLLMTTLACTATNGGSAEVTISTIAKGSYGAAEKREALLATSQADYRRIWRDVIGEGEGAPPDADFDSGVVLFLLAGTRSSGGWSVEPEAVTVESDGTAAIRATIERPKGGSMVTQALTSPYAVVFVRDRRVRKVLWPE